jgi:hypothetical protein
MAKVQAVKDAKGEHCWAANVSVMYAMKNVHQLLAKGDYPLRFLFGS